MSKQLTKLPPIFISQSKQLVTAPRPPPSTSNSISTSTSTSTSTYVSAQQLKVLSSYASSAHSVQLLDVHKCLFKLNEQVFILNKIKLENMDKSYHCYLALNYTLAMFERKEFYSSINWEIFRCLISLFANALKSYANGFRLILGATKETLIHPQDIDDPKLTFTKKQFDAHATETRHVIFVCLIIKLLSILIVNSKELKLKLIELNVLDDLMKLLNDPSYVNTSDKHKSIEYLLLVVYHISLDYKKSVPEFYGDILLKFFHVDDATAYLRCKCVLNFFPHDENFEEKIGNKAVKFIGVLKKNYLSHIKAELNSIFFIYSALKEVKYKSRLVKLILDENCYQIFLIKLSELSFVSAKFSYPTVGSLDQKLFPYFDSNQNINNAYRTIYYSYVLFQMTYLNTDQYKKLPIKAKVYLNKSLTTFLTNKIFLKNFAKHFPQTIIDLEKCLLCVYTLNENNSGSNKELSELNSNTNIFEILYNIGTIYETCSRESFLILSKIKSIQSKTINNMLEGLIKSLYAFQSFQAIYESHDVYNTFHMIYLMLEEKLNKTNGCAEQMDHMSSDFIRLIVLNDRYQLLVAELINYAMFNFYFPNEISYDKYTNQNESKKLSIFFYLIYMNWYSTYLLEKFKYQIMDHDVNVLNGLFDIFYNLILNHHKLSHSQVFLTKSAQSILALMQMDYNKCFFTIDLNKMEQLLAVLFELTTVKDFNGKKTGTLKLSICNQPANEVATTPVAKHLIIDDLVEILTTFIYYDVSTFVKFYLRLVEMYLTDLREMSRMIALKFENLSSTYHVRERDVFTSYSRNKQTITYNLLILDEFLRVNKLNETYLEEIQLQHLLKELLLNESVNLIEKKYAIDLLNNLIINDQVESLRSDMELRDKVKNLQSSNSSAMTFNRRDSIKSNMRKVFLSSCNQFNWLCSDDFASYQARPISSTEQTNILISYSIEYLSHCFKVKEELEAKFNYVVTLDPHDDIIDADVVNIDKMRKLVNDNGIFVLYLSENYKKSKYGMLQAKYAHVKRKTVIPLIMRDSFELNNWICYDIECKNWIDLTKPLGIENLSSKLNEVINLNLTSKFNSLSASNNDHLSSPQVKSNGDFVFKTFSISSFGSFTTTAATANATTSLAPTHNNMVNVNNESSMVVNNPSMSINQCDK